MKVVEVGPCTFRACPFPFRPSYDCSLPCPVQPPVHPESANSTMEPEIQQLVEMVRYILDLRVTAP